ncbi:o-succinylbenzoate synthase [Radiobacillus kanasensis]|uniref:o-succinylbenzoate synthase n=1 Tax=Radiobacillus kanasensis TaxID=2844358 RepID=UPI001E42A24A|nr:o-succinylbenzoate synthase [Radiobacillus kanasensis]UFT98994.1 o-succinylbenzoate synthase [Radiobacillus kanasensis]
MRDSIKEVHLHRLQMELKHPFETSFGTIQEKEFFIIEVVDQNGRKGYGESVAFTTPWYTEETVETTKYMLEQFLIPLMFRREWQHPKELVDVFGAVQKNNMAKAALEGAVWDLYAKKEQKPLSDILGGKRKRIEVGVSIGIQPSLEKLIQIIKKNVSAGYKRVKLKVKPGWDVEMLKEVRKAFPILPIMVDANSAYTLEDIELIKQFDQFNLMMIEQPLRQDDLVDHAILQKEIRTPICLDEGITSFTDAKAAIELGSCQVINVKIGRVGGITEAIRIHDLCQKHNIAVWCGGMLEAGIGRAHNIALASLPQFTLPGDISASTRYWETDIIEPEITMDQGYIDVSDGEGIGYDLKWDVLDTYRIETVSFSNTYKNPIRQFHKK